MQPTIYFGSLRVDEPVTLATDLLLAGICLFAFLKLRKMEPVNKLKHYLSFYFLALGLGAFFGGLLGHAFIYRLADGWKLVSWILVMLSGGMMAQAVIELARPILHTGIARFMEWLNAIALLTAIGATLLTTLFSPVKYYSLFSMALLVGSLSLYCYVKTRNRGALRIFLAVGTGALTALIFSFQWGLSPWFNHNDVSHVILSISALILYSGGLRILTPTPSGE
jgi:hypothetical protein